MKYFIGIDIGGTKCAVVAAIERESGGKPEILSKKSFPTIAGNPDATIGKIKGLVRETLCEKEIRVEDVSAIGVSCGGPLDSVRGVIMSPPNLVGWNDIAIADILKNEFGVPTFLQNDANACALAEWLYGAGKGSKNMVFMTFGTGLGAGLILDGRLYAGTNDNAGEVGHVRLEKFGPVGYAKAGSFEGFCSGAGIAQIARTKAAELLQQGKSCGYCGGFEDLQNITAKSVAEAAEKGDAAAVEVYKISGEHLGFGISLLIDILNPQVVVIGSVFARSENLLREEMQKVVDIEALPNAARVCKVVPALLGESIGDIAAISVASNGLSESLKQK